MLALGDTMSITKRHAHLLHKRQEKDRKNMFGVLTCCSCVRRGLFTRNHMSLRQARRNPWTSLSISNVRADFEVPGEIEMPAFLMACSASTLSILSYEWISDLKIKIINLEINLLNFYKIIKISLCGWGGEDFNFMINIIEVWDYFLYDIILLLLENFKQNVDKIMKLSIFYFFLMFIRKNDEIIIFHEKPCFGVSKCQKNDIFVK